MCVRVCACIYIYIYSITNSTSCVHSTMGVAVVFLKKRVLSLAVALFHNSLLFATTIVVLQGILHRKQYL